MDTALNTHQLYREALSNPIALAESDLLQLIERYPYSQPLRYAWVRRRILLKEEQQNFESTLLYAPNPTWLHDYAHKPIDIVEEIEAISEDYVPFEEYTDSVEEREPEILHESVVPEVMSTEPAPAAGGEQEELEKLVHGAGVATDYFVFEQKENEDQPQAVTTEGTTEVTEPEEEENISLYNDELMPYSFRWWLHKTRLEHADTYQPFAAPALPRPQKGQFDPRKLDEAILDQQIKENIIHFQDPEAKLSDSVSSKPLEEIGERKDNKIIEKFIREDPVIQPPSAEQLNTENMARRSAEDSYALVTETLAGIYADQGLYIKAIEVFKKLILKYPEKKSYFATQIQNLEKNL